MGRYILESGNYVYGYVFGVQRAELARIVTEYHIGTLESTTLSEDVVMLTKDDIEQLRKLFETHEDEVQEWERFEQKLCPDGSLVYGSDQERQYHTKLRSMEDVLFWVMVKAILNYLKNYPDKSSFKFISQHL